MEKSITVATGFVTGQGNPAWTPSELPITFGLPGIASPGPSPRIGGALVFVR